MNYSQSARSFHLPAPLLGLGLVRLTALLTVILQYSYVFMYNHAPESARLIVVGVLLVIHISLAVVALAKKGEPWQTAILTSISLTLICWMIAHGYQVTTTELTASEGFRNIIIFVMPLWLLAFPEYLPHRLLIAMALISIVVGGMIAFGGPPVYVSGTPRLASITGGLTQMHPSAKFIALQLVIVHQYYYARMVDRRLAIPCMAFAAIILFFYGGRNEAVFVLSYFCVLLYYKYMANAAIKWSPISIILLAIVFGAVALYFGENVNKWGSGRIGVWHHRLGLIWSRDLLTFLFGGGLGADQIWNPQWWWMEDVTAHNDFLHITMETGVIGLIAVFIFIGALLVRLPGNSKAIVVAMISESLFSNGQFQSPMLSLSYFLLASLSIYCWQRRSAEKEGAVAEKRQGQGFLRQSKHAGDLTFQHVGSREIDPGNRKPRRD